MKTQVIITLFFFTTISFHFTSKKEKLKMTCRGNRSSVILEKWSGSQIKIDTIFSYGHFGTCDSLRQYYIKNDSSIAFLAGNIHYYWMKKKESKWEIVNLGWYMKMHLGMAPRGRWPFPNEIDLLSENKLKLCYWNKDSIDVVLREYKDLSDIEKFNKFVTEKPKETLLFKYKP